MHNCIHMQFYWKLHVHAIILHIKTFHGGCLSTHLNISNNIPRVDKQDPIINPPFQRKKVGLICPMYFSENHLYFNKCHAAFQF